MSVSLGYVLGQDRVYQSGTGSEPNRAPESEPEPNREKPQENPPKRIRKAPDNFSQVTFAGSYDKKSPEL